MGYRMYDWRGKSKRSLRQETLRINSKEAEQAEGKLHLIYNFAKPYLPHT